MTLYGIFDDKLRSMGKSSLREKRERHEQILACLRSENYWTGDQICRELGISYRTLMRDLAELKETGIPIRSERGRGGGISIAGRWGLNKLQLSNSEVIALLVSLAITESINSPILADNLHSIKHRIASAFPIEQQKIISRIRKRILIGDHASKETLKTYKDPPKKILADLTDSFFNHTKVNIKYQSATGELTERTIEPHILCLVFPIWYFLSWDDLRQATRLFRIDRILSVKKTNVTFKLKKEEDLIQGARELFHHV